MSKARLFISFDIPATVRKAVCSLMDELRSTGAHVSWEQRQKFHCTLRFLGDTDQDRMPLLEKEIGQISSRVDPFDLRCEGVGFFPSDANARVVWVGLSDARARLLGFQHEVEEAVVRACFPVEPRPFQPHLTIGRIRSGNIRSGNELKELTDRAEKTIFQSDIFVVSRFMIMQSTLHPAGSVYRERKSFPLIGRGAVSEYTI